MNVYGISIKGKHPRLVTQRLYGVAENIEHAMNACRDAAQMEGWMEVVIDDVNTLGPLDFVTSNFIREDGK